MVRASGSGALAQGYEGSFAGSDMAPSEGVQIEGDHHPPELFLHDSANPLRRAYACRERASQLFDEVTDAEFKRAREPPHGDP